MDISIPNKSPSSSSDEEDLDELLFQGLFSDWENLDEDSNTDQQYLMPHTLQQMWPNHQSSQPSTTTPRRQLPAFAGPQDFVGNQNVDWLEEVCRYFHQGQLQGLQASTPPALSPPSYPPAASLTDALGGNQNADWQELVSRCFHQQGQHQSYQASAPPSPSLLSYLPADRPTDALGGNQISPLFHHHFQRYLAFRPLTTSPFRTDQAAFGLNDGVMSAEAATDTAVAGAQQLGGGYNVQATHTKQLEPQASLLPQPHSSTSMNVRLPIISTEAEIPISRTSHDSQVEEPNPVQMVTFEEIVQLIKRLKEKRRKQCLTQEDVFKQLGDGFSEKIPPLCICNLENFETRIKSVYNVIPKLMSWMNYYDQTKSPTHTSPNDPERKIRRLQTQTAIDRTTPKCQDEFVFKQNRVPDVQQIAMRNSNDDLGNDRPGTSTSEVMGRQVSEDNSFVSEKEINVKLSRQEIKPKEMMTLKEIVDFVEYFRKWRIERVLSQDEIQPMFEKSCNIKLQKNFIKELESLINFVKRILRLKPVLENWLNDIHVSRSKAE